MDIKDLIIEKRNKEELADNELEFFIRSYNNGEILEEQAGGLLTLMYTNGLTVNEMATLTNKVAETGKLQDLYKYSDRILEIHPIGGLDDKVVIALLFICSSLKLPIVKVVDREIGILDKLIGVRGYKLETEFEQIKDLINKSEIVIIDEPQEIAPVENKLYRLRKNLACNDDISLIAMSLMSRKIALGLKNIVFDISYGKNTYVKNIKDAKLLSKYLINMGKELKKGVKCIITEQSEPIGKYYGNSLELREVKEILQNQMSEDVKDYLLAIGSDILELTTDSKDVEQNKKTILEAIENGSAYQKLEGFLSYYENNDVHAEHIVPVKSDFEGYVQELDMALIRKIAEELNAIRYRKEDFLDIGAGLEFCKKIGDKVHKDEVIGYVHTNDMNKISDSVREFQEAFIISNRKVKSTSRVKENL